MSYAVGTATRNYLGDYLSAVSESPTYYLMGNGVVQVDEQLNPKMDKTPFVNNINVSGTITGYERTFPFDVQLRTTEGAIMLIEDIYRNSRIGDAAQLYYVRADLYVNPTGESPSAVYPARRFKVAVEVTSIEAAGAEIVHIKGNFHQVGDPTAGTLDPSGTITFA